MLRYDDNNIIIISDMRKILSYVMVLVFLVSCKDDDKDSLIRFTDESAELVKEGIMFGPDAESVRLQFSYPTNMTPVVGIAGDADGWLSVSTETVSSGECQLEIFVEANGDKEPRCGQVIIAVGDKCVAVDVTQEKYAGILLDRTTFDVSREGGDVAIRLWSSSELRKPSGWERWVSIGEVKALGDDYYEVVMTVDENTGHGRIASFSLRNYNESVLVSIVQRPGLFGETEVMDTDYLGGDLSLLLGYNDGTSDDGMANIRRIKRLVIEGGINDNDLDVLKAYTGSVAYPVTLDLRRATFRTGAVNPYAGYGYLSPDKKTTVTVRFDNYIPAEMFACAYGLKECLLSDDTRGIEEGAFRSVPMKRIVIPGNVVFIGDNAFNNCVELTELYIRKWSNLEELGSAVFSTGSCLESLYLSWHLSRVSPQAFEGLRVKELYLDKFNAPKWWPDGAIVDTLYVPDEEVIENYRAAQGWGDIREIRAWSAEWEDSPYPPSEP